MLVRTLLTLLIVASLLPDAFSRRPKGGRGRKSDRGPCGSLRKKMTSEEKEELGTITENCITEAGLEEDYNNFVEAEGKSMSNPTKGFMKKLKKDDSSAINDIQCCIIKEKELANEDGNVSVEKVATALSSRTDDDELKNAIEKGKEKCSDPDNCDIKAVEKCLIDECGNYLTEQAE